MVHFSETCDPDDVDLITHVVTTPATVHEAMRSEAIQRALYEKDLPPAEHLVDAANVTTEILVHARREYGTAVIGPRRPKPSWQANTPGAQTADDFNVDWENRCALCPQGKRSVSWSYRLDSARCATRSIPQSNGTASEPTHSRS